jgi:Tol biopolymer transport system component
MRRYRWLLLALALPLLAAADIGQGATKQSNIDIVATDLGHQTNLIQNRAWVVNPTVARDGRIAFFSTRDGGGDLYAAGGSALVAPVGGLSLAFASHALNHAYWARWSPNGKQLAFVRLSGPGSWSLWVVNANGTSPVKLTGSWYVPQAPAWSPRGAKLAFIRLANVSRPNETSSLWTIDTATRVKKRLAVSAARFDENSRLAWSPNGSTIALSRLDEAGIPHAADRIYTVKVKRGGLRLLAQGGGPDWSPDGQRIVFDLVTALTPNPPTEVWVVNANGTGARLLANSATEASFSPDGTRIVFDRSGEIWTMTADGSGQKQLTQAPEPDLAPLWSPDGRMIAFLRGSSLGGSSRYQLYVMNVDGSGQRQLAPSTAAELDPDWSPDGRRISFARCPSYNFRSCDVYIAKVV